MIEHLLRVLRSTNPRGFVPIGFAALFISVVGVKNPLFANLLVGVLTWLAIAALVFIGIIAIFSILGRVERDTSGSSLHGGCDCYSCAASRKDHTVKAREVSLG